MTSESSDVEAMHEGRLNVEAAWWALVNTKQSLATPKNIFTFNQHDPEQKNIAAVKYFYRWKFFLLSLLWWIVIAPPTLPNHYYAVYIY